MSCKLKYIPETSALVIDLVEFEDSEENAMKCFTLLGEILAASLPLTKKYHAKELIINGIISDKLEWIKPILKALATNTTLQVVILQGDITKESAEIAIDEMKKNRKSIPLFIKPIPGSATIPSLINFVNSKLNTKPGITAVWCEPKTSDEVCERVRA